MRFATRAPVRDCAGWTSIREDKRYQSMRIPASQVAAIASRTLVAVSVFLVATLVAAASSPCQLPQAQAVDYPYPLLAPLPRDADARGGALSWENGALAGRSAGGQYGDYLYHLPLALKNHYRYWLPPWSGNARFGFAVCLHPVEEYNVSRLHADWYVRYPGFDADPPPLFDLEFVQIIRLREGYSPPSQEAVERYAKEQPGTLWLIGNEPEDLNQDCKIPAEYAQLYYQWYNIIKAADPSAKVGIGGVVQATPLRLEWLDMVLQEYETRYGSKIPVDVWNVHGFILQEKLGSWGCQTPCGLSATQGKLYGTDDHDNMTIFKEQIVRFRQWMKDNGERNKPLIVSEYGILLSAGHGYGEARVERFMIATFDYFLTATSSSLGYPADGNRLVQAWNWFSLDRKHFEGYETYAHLFDPVTKRITALGRAYADYTGSLP